MSHDCVLAILRNENRVLLCHRHPGRAWFPNVWDFPGGHIQEFEAPEHALARELREELGVGIDPPDRPLDALLECEEASTRLTVWFIDYDGAIENRAPDEHDELRWVTLEEAREMALADERYVALIEQALLNPGPG